MSDQLSIEDYLAQGGKLTSPGNASPRYRAELMRLMATFVDSELAGSAGFAACVNDGPGITERIAAARIVLEKLDHAERVLKIMAEFGADSSRYVTHHPWTARLARDADIGTSRQGGDMRLNVFHYPIEGWIDAVAMNVLMGRATVIQLREFARVSYQPLAETFAAILPREQRHAELGLAGLQRIVAEADGRTQAQASIAYWYPRVTDSFGSVGSTRFDALKRFGIRHTPNGTMLDAWRKEVSALLADLDLAVPG